MGKHIAKVKLTLTKRTVDALMPEDKPWIAWDDKVPGFGGRVGAGRRIAGQLKLKRGSVFDSDIVSIADDKFFYVADGGSLHGISEAGRVSLLDCVGGGVLGSTGWDDFTITSWRRGVPVRALWEAACCH